MRILTAALLALAAASAGCRLTGPGDPERSIVGLYRGQWSFGIHDPRTIATGDDPPGAQSHGWVRCPAEFQVTSQDDKDISGRFELLPPNGFSSCGSRREGFCSPALIAAFCRPISGTFRGEAFSQGAREVTTILFEFRMSVAQADGADALGRFIGCRVVARQSEVFKGGVREDRDATAFMDATVDCGGQAGIGNADVAILLSAQRVPSQ